MYKLFLFFLIHSGAFASNEFPEVITDQGVLRGKYEQTWQGRTINSFTGIPFAKPPVGNLRFKPPVPAEPWNEVLDASRRGIMCVQMNIIVSDDHIVEGDEDCLYLNVHTPQLPDSNKKLLPVIFYIHGGGLISGRADMYGPNILLDKDVVLVTTNYRLGSLGFITTGDEVVPGNNGLKDQSLALLWTKKYIANFGGDPNLITVFGQSAGGICSQYHMLSPLSKDLISGAIFDSSTAVGILGYTPKGQGVRNTKKLGQFLNCPINSSQEMIECLQKIDAYTLVKEDLKFIEWNYDPLAPFKPTIEPDLEGGFLVEDPIEIIKSGRAAEVPILTGLLTEDGAFKAINLYSHDNLIQELNDNFEKIAPILMQYEETAMDKNFVSRKIREFYFGDNKIDEFTKSEVTNMITDAWFLVAHDAAVQLHYKYSKKPVYYFLFGYQEAVSYANIFGNDSLSHNYGVCHTDELIYLFSSDEVFPGYNKPTAADQMMMDVMTTMWVNFAKYGNPTPERDSLISVQWKPVESSKLEYFFIKNPTDMTMQENLYEERVQFWRNLPVDPRRTAIE